jgi:hypothetical protein
MIKYGEEKTAAWVYTFLDLNTVNGLICGSRLQKQGEQYDFLVNVVDKVRKGEVSQAEIEAYS